MEITPSIAAEAIAVLENTEISLLAKIPLKFITFLQSKADEGNAKFELDFSKSYEEQSISEEARAIITLIYKDYWCTPEEKAALEEKFEAEQIRQEEELAEKYNPDKIFENKTVSNNVQETVPSSLELVKIEELTWYQKIINKIKNLFKKQ